jgi:hypothetical protein
MLALLLLELVPPEADLAQPVLGNEITRFQGTSTRKVCGTPARTPARTTSDERSQHCYLVAIRAG